MPASRRAPRLLAPARWAVVAVSFVGTAAFATDVATWRIDSADGFRDGHREGVVVSESGQVSLSNQIKTTPKLDAAHVWDLALAGDGTLYAATGDAGRIYSRAPGADAWTIAHDDGDSQILSLAIAPDGAVFAGTGPSGQVLALKGDGKPDSSRPDPSVQYIWDLAADRDGNLYAATGPNGQLWKRSPAGAWSLLLDSAHSHLLCVAIGPEGEVYAGSDGEGLLYRIGRDGRATVLYDAPQAEVRALSVLGDGVVYAGTSAAEERTSTSGSSRTTSSTAGSATPPPQDDPIRASLEANLIALRDEPRGLILPALLQVPAPAPLAAGGTATPKPPSPGENAVYRITPEGAARQVFRGKVLIFALAQHEGRLLIGTGPEGMLHELSGDARESVPLARLDNGQVLCLLTAPDGETLLGTGDPGAVLRLSPSRRPSGTLESDVLDAKLPSRFGAIGWDADIPPKTRLDFQVRTGNVGKPDATWSEWSAPTDDPSKITAPAGRFAQWRARLSTEDPRATPALRAVFWRYQTLNLPPEIARLDVPDLSAGDGATRQISLSLKWEATDPNNDDLEYTIEVRKEGWPGWIRLGGETPLTDKEYKWDTTALPAGTYRLRVTASDRRSNREPEAETRSLTSTPFLVDHQPPTVSLSVTPPEAKVALRDGLTRLVKAAYALDGGAWVPIFPDDALFDSAKEEITISLRDLKPGTHVLTVRATDAAGNPGASDVVFEVD